MLKKPSLLSLFLCALRVLINKENKSKTSKAPNAVCEYSLVSKIKKTNYFNNFGIGIYKNSEGKKVFIKTWHGKTKNFLYYSLVNEYNTSKVLSAKINQGGSKFKVPYTIGYLKTKNSLSVIFEYAQGKPLSKFPINEQSKAIDGAILFLDRLASNLDKKDKQYIKKRDRFYYLISLPFFFLFAFLQEKESKKTILYSFFKLCLNTVFLFKKRLTISHGDLSSDNIFVTKSHFYILDTEHVKYTLAGYDLNYLFVRATKPKLLMKILENHKNFIQDKFLSLFIALQFSVVTEPKTKQRPFYQFLKNNL